MTAPNISNSSNATLVLFGHTLNETFAVTVSVYFIALTIIGTICNAILIWTILARKKLHSTANAFIVNLAVCDLLMATLLVPFEAEFLLRGYYSHGRLLCGFREVILMFSLPSSVVSLLMLTVERFVTVTYPFQARVIFTRGRTVAVITAGWIYTLLVAFFPLFRGTDVVKVEDGFCWMVIQSQYVIYQLSANFLAPLVCIIILNILLFKVARKHEIVIRNQTQTSNRRKSVISFVANMKAAKTVLLLVGVFTFCWLTFVILVAANLLCNICHEREVTWTGNAINYLSVATNPLLYGLRNKRIRREACILFFGVYARIPGVKKNRDRHNSMSLFPFYLRSIESNDEVRQRNGTFITETDGFL